MIRCYVLLAFQFLHAVCASGQGPWNNPLRIAMSNDGITFTSPAIFQDSSGVPSVIRWKGDTLIAAFQWFRLPNPSPSWDKVAMKFSYDNGLTWTQPAPVIMQNFPAGFQRPFDPTLVMIGNDSLRLYFSSSDGMPSMGLDSTVNTYSATSSDGINFYFEAGARVDDSANRVIDPAVIHFNNSWHYASPIGAPQEGAYHYVSPDGINFTAVANILSDPLHNWTGNYLVEDATELRFYGSGQYIWYNTSPNGGTWSGYVSTNIQGGDPSVLKLSANNYLMIYVGQPYTTGKETISNESLITSFPNPATDELTINVMKELVGTTYSIINQTGKTVSAGIIPGEKFNIDISDFPDATYILKTSGNLECSIKFIKH